uniref:Uncharacterized protein n=1 Tax=Timema cristinae TaxID=61476 RepID=A0A7R9CEX2_TIMCR|nr:unnamed protein product [Timema cristinae]
MAPPGLTLPLRLVATILVSRVNRNVPGFHRPPLPLGLDSSLHPVLFTQPSSPSLTMPANSSSPPRLLPPALICTTSSPHPVLLPPFSHTTSCIHPEQDVVWLDHGHVDPIHLSYHPPRLPADVLSEVKEGFGNQIHLCRDRGFNPGHLTPRTPVHLILGLGLDLSTVDLWFVPFLESVDGAGHGAVSIGWLTFSIPEL